MLRVTVDLVPFGDESRKQEIGRMEIINTGDSEFRPEKGNYTAKMIVLRDGNDVGMHQRRIVGFPRTKLNAWGLLYAALMAMQIGPAGNHDLTPIELEGWSD